MFENIVLCAYSWVHIYLPDTGTIFIILAADQIIYSYKVSYIMNMGLKSETLIFNLMSILIKTGGKVKELQLFNMYHPLFHGIVSNWTIDSKVVSWTGVNYSFIFFCIN